MSLEGMSKILIIDDERLEVKALSGILGVDFEISTALNGQQALQTSTELPLPDMSLLDVGLPEMDGYTVCQKLKANPITASITSSKHHRCVGCCSVFEGCRVWALM